MRAVVFQDVFWKSKVYLVELFEDNGLCAVHVKHAMIMPKISNELSEFLVNTVWKFCIILHNLAYL